MTSHIMFSIMANALFLGTMPNEVNTWDPLSSLRY